MTLAARFLRRFKCLDRAYGTFTIDPNQTGIKTKGKARTVAGKVTEAMWQSHLDGVTGLGVVPICADNTCIWGLLDVDQYDLDLAALEKKIAELKLPLIVCRTKSGGAHLILFCSEPVPASLIQSKLALFARALGFNDIEIFPKQTTIGPKDTGNWVNSCYYDVKETNRYAIENGLPISAERFLELASEREVTKTQLQSLEPIIPIEPFSDGPPCLQHLVKIGFPEGSRNHALFDCGVYYRNKYAEGWQEHVSAANQKWMKPGSIQEVIGVIKSLDKKGYKYKCSDQPLAPHCKRGECAKRQFGVPDGRTKKENEKANRPCILDQVDKPIRCFQPPAGSNDDATWEFKMCSQKLTLNIEQVRSQALFLKEHFKHFHHIVLLIDEQRWADAMNELFETEEQESMPTDAGPEGQLWTHLENFCTGKSQGKDRQDLVMGRPWSDELTGRTYFRSGDLMKYLDQQRFKAYKEPDIWPVLKRRDLGHHQFNIKGRCVWCWSVPTFVEQNEPFDNVEIPDDNKPF